MRLPQMRPPRSTAAARRRRRCRCRARRWSSTNRIAPDDVVLVHELEARVEAEDRRHERQLERLGERRDDVGAEHVGEPQQRHGHVRVVLGEVAHVALDLEQAALDPAARRRACAASPRGTSPGPAVARRTRASTTSRRRCARCCPAPTRRRSRFIVPITLISCIARPRICGRVDDEEACARSCRPAWPARCGRGSSSSRRLRTYSVRSSWTRRLVACRGRR